MWPACRKGVLSTAAPVDRVIRKYVELEPGERSCSSSINLRSPSFPSSSSSLPNPSISRSREARDKWYQRLDDLDSLYQKPRYQTKDAKQAAAMEEQNAALAKAVNDGRAANDARLDAIQQSLEMWRPAVTNLQQQLDELRTQVGRIALHPALASSPATQEDAVVRPIATNSV